MPSFALDQRLEGSSHLVQEWPLCQLRLKDDARFAWLLLIPQRPGVTEFTDLAAEDYAQLWREILAATRLVQRVADPDKVNVGMLGNIVAQMHVHVVGRWRSDPAWPGSVWAAGEGPRFEPSSLVERLQVWREGAAALGPKPSTDGPAAVASCPSAFAGR